MLHENCMLVRLSISMPPQSKQARSASKEVEAKYRTAEKQGRVVKQLFSVKDIKPLTKVMSMVRTMFNEISLPYDAAYRIIPTSSYFNFIDQMKPLANEFDKRKGKFLNEYHIILMRAERDLGDLFNEDDYPTVGALDQRIHLSIETSVIPSGNAFDELAGLTPEAIEKLKAEALAGQQEKIEEALMDLFKRLFDSLRKASSKLADEDGIFRDTLISNINAAIEAVETLNLTNNQDLINIANEVKGVIENVTPDELRKDKDLRAETAEATKELVDKMKDFF